MISFRFLATRAHGKTPFLVSHGFEADLPQFMRTLSKEVPRELTDEALELYLNEAVDRAIAIQKRVKANLATYDSRSKAYYDRQLSELEVAVYNSG